VADAAQTFAAILAEEPENAAAHGGLIRAHLAIGELDRADELLAAIPAAIASAPEIEAARAQLALARQALNAGPIAELTAAVDGNPNDHAARFELAQALYARGDVQGAVDQLLDLFRRDREWNEGAAKTQLFTIFEALKPQDPIALAARRKLSSMIFA
jgi:putative thioredoxin